MSGVLFIQLPCPMHDRIISYSIISSVHRMLCIKSQQFVSISSNCFWHSHMKRKAAVRQFTSFASTNNDIVLSPAWYCGKKNTRKTDFPADIYAACPVLSLVLSVSLQCSIYRHRPFEKLSVSIISRTALTEMNSVLCVLARKMAHEFIYFTASPRLTLF